MGDSLVINVTLENDLRSIDHATTTRTIQIRINEVIVNGVIYHHTFEFYFRDLVVVIWRRGT